MKTAEIGCSATRQNAQTWSSFGTVAWEAVASVFIYRPVSFIDEKILLEQFFRKVLRIDFAILKMSLIHV